MNSTQFTLTGNDLPPGTFDASSGGAFIASSVSFFVGILLVSIPVIFFASFFISLLKSDSEKSLSVLKDTMRRAAIGFFTLIVMMALFTFINPRLLDFQWFSMGGENITNTASLSQNTQVEKDTSNAKPVTQSNLDLASITNNEADVRAIFTRADIKVNAMACTSVGQKSCTTVGGMSPDTINMLLTLKKACNCDMTISGGTEWWAHSMTTKHRPGPKTAVDLRKDLYLTNFIKAGTANGFSPALSWSTCYSAFTWNGFYFCDEKNTAAHWHVDPL